MNQFDVSRIFLKQRMAPTGIRIDNYSENDNGFFSLNGPYMVVFETFLTETDTVQISMISPGFNFPYHCELVWFTEMRPLHKHNFVEFMFVVRGHIKQRIEGNIYDYSEGQCCVIMPGINHSETVDGDAELVFLMISDELLYTIIQTDHRYSSDGREYSSENILYQAFRNHLEKTESTNQYYDFFPLVPNDIVLPIIKKHLTQITLETGDLHPGFYSFVIGSIQRLIAQMLNNQLYSYRQVSKDSQYEENLFLKITAILEETHGRITRQEISNKLLYSDHHINKIIQDNTGMSLIKYSRIFTLKEAARRLTQTEDSISAIIYDLGFTNRTHFYNLFKEQYGVSPSQYKGANSKAYRPLLRS